MLSPIESSVNKFSFGKKTLSLFSKEIYVEQTSSRKLSRLAKI